MTDDEYPGGAPRGNTWVIVSVLLVVGLVAAFFLWRSGLIPGLAGRTPLPASSSQPRGDTDATGHPRGVTPDRNAATPLPAKAAGQSPDARSDPNKPAGDGAAVPSLAARAAAQLNGSDPRSEVPPRSQARSSQTPVTPGELRDELASLHDQVGLLNQKMVEMGNQLNNGSDRRGLGGSILDFIVIGLLLALFQACWTWYVVKDVYDEVEGSKRRLEILSGTAERISTVVSTISDKLRQAMETLPAAEPPDVLGRGRARDVVVTHTAPMPAPQPEWRDAESWDRVPSPPPLSLVEIYNRAWEDKEQEAAFWKKYPGEFLGIVNDSERTRRPGIPALFGPAGNGDFYAFSTPTSRNRYQVVPRFGRAPTRERLGGAWGEVFECSQVDPDRTPARVRLMEPASFERIGDSWKIVDRGRISAV